MSRPTTIAKSYLRIGQIAERSGVSAKALRPYEQRGLLKPCAHSESGYRLYGPDALRRLMQIMVLKRSGFSLAEIGRLLARDSTAAAHLLATRIETLERDVADRTQALEAYIAQPDAMAAQGMDPAMFRYIGEAMAKAGLSLAR